MDRKKYKIISIPFFKLSNVSSWSKWYLHTWLPLVTNPNKEWPDNSLHLPCLTDSGNLYGYFGLSKAEGEKVSHIKFFQEADNIKPLTVIHTIISKVKELTENNYDIYWEDPNKLYEEICELILEHKELFGMSSFYKSIGRLILPGGSK